MNLFIYSLCCVAESWNPAWSVASILTGLLSFMLEETSTTGSLQTTLNERKMLCRQSHEWNRKFNAKFVEIFPDLLSKQPPVIYATSPNDTASNTSDIQAQSKQQQIADDDVVMNELNSIVESSLFKMLFGGVIFYLLFVVIQRLLFM